MSTLEIPLRSDVFIPTLSILPSLSPPPFSLVIPNGRTTFTPSLYLAVGGSAPACAGVGALARGHAEAGDAAALPGLPGGSSSLPFLFVIPLYHSSVSFLCVIPL